MMLAWMKTELERTELSVPYLFFTLFLLKQNKYRNPQNEYVAYIIEKPTKKALQCSSELKGPP
jgi:hypothetical protein